MVGCTTTPPTHPIELGSLPDLSQSRINIQFTKYLDFCLILHPNKYTKEEIFIIKNQINHGLCYGYTKFRRWMKDRGLKDNFSAQLIKISLWDQCIETLKTDSELTHTFDITLTNIFNLHMSDSLRGNKKINSINIIKLEELIDYGCYKEVFSAGFVFKYNELENLISKLYILQKVFDIHLI